VHRGHRHVFEVLAGEAADAAADETAVLTFDPHPLRVVAPEQAPRMLTALDHRLELFEAAGFGVAAVLGFDTSIRDLSPVAFASEVLAGALGAAVVVVGEDFRFGRDRTGHVGLLTEAGTAHSFTTAVVPLVGGDRPLSSTRIRTMVAAGDVAGAGEALGRLHEVRGVVVPGDGRGSTIGVPTANLELAAATAVPAHGVYAGWAGPVGEPPVRAVANVGVRPTFGGDRERVEVHLLDTERDLYGLRVRLRFAARIREERRFSGPDELVAQITRDIAAAGELL
jgi:riboflavin kinase/FMN adenylyltransferase